MIEQQPMARRRPRLLLAAAGLGGVVLGVLVLVTAVRGDREQAAVRSTAPQASTTTVLEKSGQQKQSLPVASVPVPAEGRDPFVPVVAVPRADSGQVSRAVSSMSTQPASPPVVPPAPAASAAGGAYASLELKSIFQDGGRVRADLTVDGQIYRPAEGEAFAYGYRLERVDGSCVEVSAQEARARMCLPSPVS